MKQRKPGPGPDRADAKTVDDLDLPDDLDLTDEDVLDAMRHISGYLDISIEDFRAVYHLAHAHAIERLFQRVRAGDLMIADTVPLRPEMTIGEALKQLTRQRRKSLPVVDGHLVVVGILTETDILRCLGADSYLDLLLDMIEAHPDLSGRCGHTSVSAVMTTPAATVLENAGFAETIRAFRRHQGRSMPVVDDDGRLRGLLLRKDFLQACPVGATA